MNTLVSMLLTTNKVETIAVKWYEVVTMIESWYTVDGRNPAVVSNCW